MPSITLPYPPSATAIGASTGTRAARIAARKRRPTSKPSVGSARRTGLTEPLLETVSVRLAYHRAPGRRIDLDNGLKQLLDALQGFAYSDDKQIVHLEAELVELPRNRKPYVVVTIVPCEARVLEDAR